ncbi:hypothetical protein OBK04_01685 [Empedobacter falsenii]
MNNKLYFVIFTAFIALYSCQSSKNATTNNTQEIEHIQHSDLIGRWKLVKLSGGIIGREQLPPTNMVTVLEFTPTEMITIINGKETNRTTYTIAKGKSIHTTELVPMIYTNGNPSMGKSFQVDQNTLGINEEFNDGFYYTYIKIGENDNGLLRE